MTDAMKKAPERVRVYRCRGCQAIYQARVWCDCGDQMKRCDIGAAVFPRPKATAFSGPFPPVVLPEAEWPEPKGPKA